MIVTTLVEFIQLIQKNNFINTIDIVKLKFLYDACSKGFCLRNQCFSEGVIVSCKHTDSII